MGFFDDDFEEEYWEDRRRDEEYWDDVCFEENYLNEKEDEEDDKEDDKDDDDILTDIHEECEVCDEEFEDGDCEHDECCNEEYLDNVYFEEKSLKEDNVSAFDTYSGSFSVGSSSYLRRSCPVENDSSSLCSGFETSNNTCSSVANEKVSPSATQQNSTASIRRQPEVDNSFAKVLATIATGIFTMVMMSNFVSCVVGDNFFLFIIKRYVCLDWQ